MARSSPEAPAEKKRLGLRLFRHGQQEDPAPEAPLHVPDLGLRDPETGLPNLNELNIVLQREIARSRRYGDTSALAVIDLRIASYRPTATHPLPPSPAKYVGTTLLEAARDADVVARIATTRFAVLLTECNERGASNFVQRCRTKMSTEHYARTEDDLPVYVRTWAGYECWKAAYLTPEEYLAAAADKLEKTFVGYEAAQSFFRPD